MFRNFRDGRFALGLVAGIGITLLVSLAVPDQVSNDPDRDHQQDDDRQEDQRELHEGEKYLDWVIGPLDRLVSLEDTAAQWLMTILSSLAAYLLWRTLVATQKMAVETRRIGERQVRAYVSVASVRIDRRAAEPLTHLEVRNFGQSPAYDVGSWINTWVEAYPLRVALPDPTEVDMFSRSTLAQGGSLWHDQPHGVTLDDIARREMTAGRAAFYVYGRIEYRDVFGEAHDTRYLFYYKGSPDDWDGRVMSYPHGNQSN